MKFFAKRFFNLYLTVLVVSLLLSLFFGIRPIGYSHEMRRVVLSDYPTYVHAPETAMDARVQGSGLSDTKIRSLDRLEASQFDFQRALKGSDTDLTPILLEIRSTAEDSGRFSAYALSAFIWLIVILVFTGVQTLLDGRRRSKDPKALSKK